MKICYIADTIIHTRRWIEFFVKKGHDVHLITYEPPDEPFQGVKLYVLKSIFSNLYLDFPFRQLKIMQIIKDIEPDIVHAHFVAKFGFHGALLGFHPLVISAWGSDILVIPDQSRLLKSFTIFSLKKADLITCDGENIRDRMISMGIERKKIQIIFHGVDTCQFNSSYRNDLLRKDLDISNSPVIISTRNLKQIYNVESLIRAIPFVLDKHPDAKFIIIGQGEMKGRLLDMAESLNILKAIRFIGFIQHDRLQEYLASSDIYISTSLSDGGIAISTLEAMACGLTPIVTDVGDNIKWITDSYNGYVVPLKDSRSMAEKIIHLIENKEVREQFGVINEKIVKERADYNNEMEKMEKLYEKLIGRDLQ